MGVKLLTRLRLKFSHLNDHKFCNKFRDCAGPCITVALKLKQLNTFFLSCQFLDSERQNLPDDLYLIDSSITSFHKESL